MHSWDSTLVFNFESFFPIFGDVLGLEVEPTGFGLDIFSKQPFPTTQTYLSGSFRQGCFVSLDIYLTKLFAVGLTI